MRGDAKAFPKLYQIFFNTIYFNVCSTLVNKSDVEDAVQQVLISLHKGLANLKSPYAFHSYLYRVTMNVCSKFNQKEARLRYVSLEEVEQLLVDDKNEVPPQVFEAKERDELVRFFISKLPKKQRYTLLLYYYYDLSYKDIAEAMDTTVTVVGSNISRAKRNMKLMLEEYENKLAEASSLESDDTFKGTSLDALFTAGFIGAVDQALSPEKAEILWRSLTEQLPQLATTAGAVSASAAYKAIVAGVAASGMVLGAATIALHYVHESLETNRGSKAVASLEVSESLFMPQSVSINMANDNPAYPETYNPVFAEIVLSEGFPVEWLIRDEKGREVLRGRELIVGHTTFGSLPAGNYQIEWTISNEKGETGVASREFTIIEENNAP
ncbi:MAG: sigma-70 family RNA polymerase sigma factor [Coriobacteriales bacterium]|jgi:RNA polymerase sigma factor (sigma-70 family)|nr:sigma-70 family RNA polymerase sigma factor [Coriobacteriales bacterium]